MSTRVYQIVEFHFFSSYLSNFPGVASKCLLIEYYICLLHAPSSFSDHLQIFKETCVNRNLFQKNHNTVSKKEKKKRKTTVSQHCILRIQLYAVAQFEQTNAESRVN